MKKYLFIILALFLMSCKKEPQPEPIKEVPCKVLKRRAYNGYMEVKILITEQFDGMILVKNPTIYSPMKTYYPRVVDTTFIDSRITINSKIAINYGWGQLEK